MGITELINNVLTLSSLTKNQKHISVEDYLLTKSTNCKNITNKSLDISSILLYNEFEDES